MKRIQEFEALRGLLALWVVIGHAFKHAGYGPQTLGHFGLLADPGLAVDVFIVLSGFVIFDLLDTKHEGYGAFIVRRFFRIFPLYITSLGIGVLLAGVTLEWLEMAPWKTTFIEGTIAIARSTVTNLSAHFFVHLTGLHGLVPDHVLPFSQYGIVGQAWSISVEWQFYLIAPLLYLSLRKMPIALAIILLILIAIHSRYWLGEGFAVGQAQFFLVGIICYFAYKNCPHIDGSHLLLGATAAIAAFGWFTPHPASMSIWVMFFAAALHNKHGGDNLLSRITARTWAQLAGRISYSIYLLHMFALMLVSLAVLKYLPKASQVEHISIVLPASIICSVLSAWVAYTGIEKPGMDIGRSAAKALSMRRQKLFAAG